MSILPFKYKFSWPSLFAPHIWVLLACILFHLCFAYIVFLVSIPNIYIYISFLAFHSVYKSWLSISAYIGIFGILFRIHKSFWPFIPYKKSFGLSYIYGLYISLLAVNPKYISRLAVDLLYISRWQSTPNIKSSGCWTPIYKYFGCQPTIDESFGCKPPIYVFCCRPLYIRLLAVDSVSIYVFRLSTPVYMSCGCWLLTYTSFGCWLPPPRDNPNFIVLLAYDKEGTNLSATNSRQHSLPWW